MSQYKCFEVILIFMRDFSSVMKDYMLSPKGAFCSLPSTCLVLPGAATCWLALKPCSAQKRRSKKALFTLCTGPCLWVFGFQCEKGPVFAAAPSKLFCGLHIHPPCAVWALNPVGHQGEPAPGSFSVGTTGRAWITRGWAWITEKGKSGGACARAAGLML